MSVLLMSTLAVVSLAQAEPRRDLERKRVAGVVETIEGQEAYIRTDDGARVSVQLGPQSYWRERGYRLRSGSRVEADCWYDPEGRSDWYFAGSIWGPGFHFELSNGDGIPYWVDNDDYYYSDGWGPSCDSYVIWYDCAPSFYIYAPPPPPRYHFYGPRWRSHWRDWNHRYYRHHDNDHRGRGGWNGGHDGRHDRDRHDGGWDRNHNRGHDNGNGHSGSRREAPRDNRGNDHRRGGRR
jgi:hypothetical protein